MNQDWPPCLDPGPVTLLWHSKTICLKDSKSSRVKHIALFFPWQWCKASATRQSKNLNVGIEDIKATSRLVSPPPRNTVSWTLLSMMNLMASGEHYASSDQNSLPNCVKLYAVWILVEPVELGLNGAQGLKRWWKLRTVAITFFSLDSSFPCCFRHAAKTPLT